MTIHPRSFLAWCLAFLGTFVFPILAEAQTPRPEAKIGLFRIVSDPKPKEDAKFQECKEYPYLVDIQGPGKSQVSICSKYKIVFDANGLASLRDSYAIHYSRNGKKPEMVENQDAFMAVPVQIRVKEGEVSVAERLSIQNPRTKRPLYYPFLKKTISCKSNSCAPVKEACAFNIKKTSLPQDAVARLEAFMTQEKEKISDPTQALNSWMTKMDSVLLLALAGDQKARRTLENYPWKVDGMYAEIQATYIEQYLKPALRAGCFR